MCVPMGVWFEAFLSITNNFQTYPFCLDISRLNRNHNFDQNGYGGNGIECSFVSYAEHLFGQVSYISLKDVICVTFKSLCTLWYYFSFSLSVIFLSFFLSPPLSLSIYLSIYLFFLSFFIYQQILSTQLVKQKRGIPWSFFLPRQS